MKQTVVEWLMVQLETYGDPEYCKIEWETLDELIKQAKELENVPERISSILEAQQQLIEVLTNQVMDLTMMSKIELGDDVIEEIKRLKKIINEKQR